MYVGEDSGIYINNPNINDMDTMITYIQNYTGLKNERDGHIYGFMPSWRKDIPKEAR